MSTYFMIHTVDMVFSLFIKLIPTGGEVSERTFCMLFIVQS